FRKTHDEQIKLVSDLSWYDYGALDGIKEECAEIFAASKDIDAERREKLTSAIAARCGHIERLRRN
ncbi:MAG: excisionase, partial [Clostridiales Family XIII bacterium]|nr:excisionase [Clostridiales Family XIII bacterium]